MDRAQALAEPYLKIVKIVSDLAETLKSPEPSIASLLLERIELHNMDLHCLCFMVDDQSQSFTIPLPPHFAEGFLRSMADGVPLSEIYYPQKFYLCADGVWEALPLKDLIMLGEEIEKENTWELPFSEFRTPRPEFEQRLLDKDIPVPSNWLGRGVLSDENETKQKISSDPGTQEKVLHWYEKDGILYEGLAEDVRKTKKPNGEKASENIRDILRAGGYHNTSWHLLEAEYKMPNEAQGQVDSANEYNAPGVAINFSDSGVPGDKRMTEKDRSEYVKNIRLLRREINHLQETDENPAALQDKIDLCEIIQQELNRRTRPGGEILNEFSEQHEKATATLCRGVKRKIARLRDRGQEDVADYVKAFVHVGPECWYDDGGWKLILDPPEG